MSETIDKPLFVNGDFVPSWDIKKIVENQWSNREKGLIKANYKKMDDNALSELIGRPKPATTMKRCSMELYRVKKVGKKSWKHWNEKDLTTLDEEWKNKTDEELAKQFKRSTHSVKLKRIELGLLRGEWNGRKRKK